MVVFYNHNAVKFRFITVLHCNIRSRSICTVRFYYNCFPKVMGILF